MSCRESSVERMNVFFFSSAFLVLPHARILKTGGGRQGRSSLLVSSICCVMFRDPNQKDESLYQMRSTSRGLSTGTPLQEQLERLKSSSQREEPTHSMLLRSRRAVNNSSTTTFSLCVCVCVCVCA